MYPYHRLVKMFIVNAFKKKKDENIEDEFIWKFRPGLGDIDLYPEVNNGRHFVLFDLARYDLAFRIRLVKYVMKNKYAFVIGGSTIRYRRRLAPFRRAFVRTKLVGADEKFFYFQQTTEQKGQVKSSALIRAGIRKKGGTVEPQKLMSDLGYEMEPFMEDWVSEWANWDDNARPWPEPYQQSKTDMSS